MRITYDKEANAAYIYFKENVKVVVTKGDWPFHIDLDENSEVVGIEVMDAREILSEEFLESSQS